MEDPLQTQQFFDFDMISAGDGLNSYTISAADGAMKVIAEPVRLEFNIADELFFSLAFQSTRTLENALIDDVTVPNVDQSCSLLFPGLPRNTSGTGNVMSGIHGVAWVDDAPVLISDSVAAGHNYLPNVAMVLFNIDPSDDNDGLYARPAGPNCDVLPKLQHTPWHPFNSYWDSSGVLRDVGKMTPDGTAGSQRNEGRIVGVGPAQEVLIHAEGLVNPTGIDRYPGFKPKVSGLSLFVKIESPVNVVITAPDGRRIGVDPETGLALNEFGLGGYDSSTAEPHVYGIRHPMPGAYTIDTVGTGTGPFRITTYGVNFETMAVTKTTFAGDTAPGNTTEHEFELTPTGSVATSEVVDATPPVVTPTTTGSLGANGWYRSSVGVTWNVTDPESEIASRHGCDDATLTADTAGEAVTCVASSAGGSASATVTVRIDATPPTVSYSGQQAAYPIDQFVTITCAASDALSGLASNTCADIGGAAYEFDSGPNTFSATAVDLAGNTGSASVTFTVDITNAGVCGLVKRFVTNKGIANALCSKLNAAERQAPTAKAGSLTAFANQIRAQTGKALSAEEAGILIRLAGRMP